MDEPLFFLLSLAVEGPFRAPTALCSGLLCGISSRIVVSLF